MLEAIVTGIAQGVAEWLPVSSEGVIVLLKTNFFGETNGVVAIGESIFLHLGTSLAALIYLRRDIFRLLHTLVWNKQADIASKKTLLFLVITTFVTGLLAGFVFNTLLDRGMGGAILTSGSINLIIGLLLLVTAGLLHWSHNKSGEKRAEDLSYWDGILLGVMQALAIIPGISRSGTTMAGLLLRKFGKELSLRLSFLMSIPVVLGANLMLLVTTPQGFEYWNSEALVALVFSFIFGWLTIDILIKLARKINFAYFVLFFAILTLFADIIS